jgi:hypothetical protein
MPDIRYKESGIVLTQKNRTNAIYLIGNFISRA